MICVTFLYSFERSSFLQAVAKSSNTLRFFFLADFCPNLFKIEKFSGYGDHIRNSSICKAEAGDRHKFKATLVYIVTSRPAEATL